MARTATPATRADRVPSRHLAELARHLFDEAGDGALTAHSP
ncbi:hypothetical protein [Streptomyces sp. NPDC048473]